VIRASICAVPVQQNLVLFVAQARMNSHLLQYRANLVGARRSRALVRVRRSLEAGWADGYVVGVGSEFVALCLVSDLIIFNGFRVFRLVDLSELEVPAPHAAFVERALRLREAQQPQEPSIDLKELSSLLQSVAAAFRVIAVHREVKDPDVCHIGFVENITKSSLVLKPIGADGDWLEKHETFALADVTRIDFGGLYEDALRVVAEAG
jgi:hypothetical protein